MIRVIAPPKIPGPFTTLVFVENNPVSAHVDPEARVGSMRVVLRGDVPADISVYISENFPNVTPENASWTFKEKKVFSLLPRDQRIINPKKQTDKDSRILQKLYMLFVTSEANSEF